MSQSETYVPGMNSAGNQSNNDLYSRHQTGTSSANSYSANGTYVPGMQAEVVKEASGPQNVRNNDGEPVVGFLYSISRMGIGEYWPLHLGANTIGRSGECDIQLKEASVSDKHATLNIKRMKTTQTLIASVTDTGSKNGMYLNDEELDYNQHSCKNGDVLTVGTCYQLLVVLINATEYGLTVAENFVPFEDSVEVPDNDVDDSFLNSTYSRAQRRYTDDGTVDLSGAKNFTSPGETKIM